MENTLENLKRTVRELIEAGKDIPVHKLHDIGKDYIDYLGFRKNPIDHNAMRGVDQYERKFFVFKIIIYNPDHTVKNFGQRDDTEFYMDTLFQRYTSTQHSYQVCGHFSSRSIATCGGTRPCQFQFYINLLTKGKATITEDIRPESDGNIGWTAILGTEKEWNAAKIIQRNWRKVSLDPLLYMCKRVQMRDTMDYGAGFKWEDLRGLFPKWSEEDFRKTFPVLFPSTLSME